MVASVSSLSSISSISSIGSYHTDVLVISVEYEKVQKGGEAWNGELQTEAPSFSCSDLLPFQSTVIIG